MTRGYWSKEFLKKHFHCQVLNVDLVTGDITKLSTHALSWCFAKSKKIATKMPRVCILTLFKLQPQKRWLNYLISFNMRVNSSLFSCSLFVYL